MHCLIIAPRPKRWGREGHFQAGPKGRYLGARLLVWIYFLRHPSLCSPLTGADWCWKWHQRVTQESGTKEHSREHSREHSENMLVVLGAFFCFTMQAGSYFFLILGAQWWEGALFVLQCSSKPPGWDQALPFSVLALHASKLSFKYIISNLRIFFSISNLYFTQYVISNFRIFLSISNWCFSIYNF